MISGNSFPQNKDGINNGTGHSRTEETAGTQVNDGQKPEFDTYGTALNEL